MADINQMLDSGRRLGKALTILGLETKFLENGELQKRPLLERGVLANGIIDSKLEEGDWEGVVQMMFGGLGKAEALYEGNLDELRARIVQAAASRNPSGIKDRTVEALRDREEYQLLFDIMISAADLKLGRFSNISERVRFPEGFFEGEEGTARYKRYVAAEAQKALEAGEGWAALDCYIKLNDVDNARKAVEMVIDRGRVYTDSADKLASMAHSLGDRTLAEGILTRIIQTWRRDEGLRAVDALELAKKRGVKLPKSEERELYEAAAQKAARYELERMPHLGDDSKFLLLWAKRHAESDPRAAWNIFQSQNYNGGELLVSIKAGVSLNPWDERDTHRNINVEEVPEEQLRQVYPAVDFKVKERVAAHLKDSGALQELSRLAESQEDYRTAYRLWIESGASLDGEYIDGLRTRLIEGSTQNEFCGFDNFDKSDLLGKRRAFDAAMAHGAEKPMAYAEAYQIARRMGDEDLVQRAREEIAGVDLNWALRVFDKDDSAGRDYVLDKVAQRTGADKSQLAEIVGKYQLD